MKSFALLALGLLSICNTGWGGTSVYSNLIVAPPEATNPVPKPVSRSCGQIVNQVWVSLECPEWSQEEKAEMENGHISDNEIIEFGGALITRTYLVLYETHHGIFLLPDTQDISAKFISIVFGNNETSKLFVDSYDELLQRTFKRVYCECTGLYYEQNGRKTLKVKQARLFIRDTNGQ